MFTEKDILKVLDWAEATTTKWLWIGIEKTIEVVNDLREPIREAVADIKVAVDFVHDHL